MNPKVISQAIIDAVYEALSDVIKNFPDDSGAQPTNPEVPPIPQVSFMKLPVPFAGETSESFNARSFSNPVPDFLKFDPWAIGPDGTIGVWVPVGAPFKLPPN